MTDANQDHQGIAVVQGDVELEKAVDADGFGVPSLVFTVHAPADERVAIRIRDPVPEAVDAGDIGFHPNHGGEFWTYDGDAVVFEREFEPGETYTTVYGIAGADAASDDWLLDEPSVEATNADGDDAQADDAPTIADVADADPGDAAGDEQADEGRLDRLRNDVDSLTATVESLEARVGGRGGSGTIDAESVAADVEAIRDRLADLEDEIGSSRVRASSVSAEVDELRGTVESIREETDELAADVRETADGVQRNARDIDDIGGEVAELAATVDALASEVRPAEDDDRMAALEDDVEAMREDVEAVIAFQERLAASLGEFEAE